MKSLAQQTFALEPGLIQLNHASYGLPTRSILAKAESVRAQIESDPNRYLGGELTEQLRTETTLTAHGFGLEPHLMTLCSNATAGAAALMQSLPLTAVDTVVVLDTEYSSIRRGWEIACAKAGAQLIVCPVSLPFHEPEQLLAALDARVPDRVTYLQASAISSSAAIRLPVHRLSKWVRSRGGELILDAAHAPGHIRLSPTEWGVTAMFGTMHKWLPSLRPVGFLWLAPELVDRVHPAEVSLTWDSPDLVERFSWPGTYDPVPRLCLSTAAMQWLSWNEGGLLTDCDRLAHTASQALEHIGARPTSTNPLYLPPRMRAFILDDVTVSEVKAALSAAGIRAWVGPSPQGETLLRVSTHIYNDDDDINSLTSRLQEVLAR
ncbi:aminotransferase class V-fold PLP-dependent enzyme [Nocardia sp. NPDC058058]|uniref:aminotransferase class V-fold PLP-dependent enzyme n=1 Tax=Nocardia sp. NPDC058058 TaxID=3346317 RepID=UPI0036DF61A3